MMVDGQLPLDLKTIYRELCEKLLPGIRSPQLIGELKKIIGENPNLCRPID